MIFGFAQSRPPADIKNHWRALYQRDLPDYEKDLREELTWRDWDRNMMPDDAAAQRFSMAVRILSGSEDWALAKQYAERSLEIVERIIREDKLHSDRCIDNYPRNQGVTRRTQAYAQALLGQPLDASLLLAASKDYEADCKHYKTARDWNEQIQYYFINAIHLSLLGDDLKRAATLLKGPQRPLKAHTEHVALLKGLIRFAEGELDESEQATFVTDFEAFFDKVRDPRRQQPKGYFMEIVGPLEMGLLLEKYVNHPGEEINWQRVIDRYSQ